MAQPMCRSNLYDKGRIRGRNAFACMEGLIEKGLVRKEIVRDAETDGEVEKWGLLRDGEALGKPCADFDRAVNRAIPIQRIDEKVRGGASNGTDLALCLDAREDVHLLERMKWSCEDEGISFVERELVAGDYLFVERRDGREFVSPLVVERKTWSDLADSCIGKGRALNRLDCVKLESDSECSGNCQLCKMKRSGARQIMFIVEGERCIGSDGVHRTAKKCSKDNCCAVCRQLSERHNVTQDALEGVLHRLQIEHGCHIHYTKCYNETIQSLFDIRSLLQTSQNCISEESIPFESFASNARRSSTAVRQLPPRPASVQEINVEAMVALVANGKWDLGMVRGFLGMNTPGQVGEMPNHKQSLSASKESQLSPVVELKDSSDDRDPICIDLESSIYRNVRKRKKRETICLDSDSEIESEGERNNAKRVRGGCNPRSSSGDEDIEVLVQGDSQISKSGNPKDSRADSDSNYDGVDSDDDIFSHLGHFEGDKRRKLLEKTYDDDSDSSADFGQSSNKRKNPSGEKKACGRRTPPKSSSTFHDAKKSASLSKARDIIRKRRPATSSVAKAKKLQRDVCLLSSSDGESPEKQPITRRKSPPSAFALKTAEEADLPSVRADGRAKAANDTGVEIPPRIQQTNSGMVPDEEDTLHDIKHVYPLLILHGWDEYSQQCYKRLDRMWKDIYSNTTDSSQMNDLYAKSVTRLGGLIKESAFPFVRRRTLVRFILWMQLTVGLQVRLVQRIRFAEEIKACVACKFSATKSLVLSPTASCRSRTKHPECNVPYSAPITSKTLKSSSNQNSAMSVGRKIPASTRESVLVRDARLRRFDKTSDQAASSVDRHKERPNKWFCPQCTLENNLADETCSACGGDYPMKQLPMAPRVESWSCSSCTFENESIRVNCSVCGASKSPAPVMSHVASPSSNNHAEHLTSPNSSCSTSKPALNKRVIRCGACSREGHNRSNATEHNCPAYFDEKEIERRGKNRCKREASIAKERDQIRAIEQESQNDDRMQEELARQIEALQKNKERAEDFRKEELKRRKQKLQRLQKRQDRNKS